MSERLDELKEEATELGIDFNPRIGEVKLQEKIDAYYESQETSGKEIQETVEAEEAKKTDEEKSEEKSVASGIKSIENIAREVYEKAKKTVVVTIIDNDQRVNNQTTMCKANWSNQYHDLGTRTIPLNTPVQIPQGFINVLKEVMIPMHTRDAKTNMTRTVMRPRYTIQVENTNPEEIIAARNK